MRLGSTIKFKALGGNKYIPFTVNGVTEIIHFDAGFYVTVDELKDLVKVVNEAISFVNDSFQGQPDYDGLEEEGK